MKRGSCPGGDESSPKNVRSQYGSTGYVTFANAAIGEIGSLHGVEPSAKTSTTTAASAFEPVNGGVDQACRGGTPTDNSASYYMLHRNVAGLEACKSKCIATVGCKGIEFNERWKRCEVWTRAEGICASTAVAGFMCLRYADSSSASTTSRPGGVFEPMNGGVDQACRGRNSNDNSASYYNLHGSVADLENCKSKCLSTSGCKGIEYSGKLRLCEIWTRPDGIQASKTLTGFTCLVYATPSKPPSTTTLTSTTTTLTTTIPVTTTAGCATVWNQCGGKNFKGPSCCEAGSTCSFGNEWYSQCKPSGSMLLASSSKKKRRSRVRKFLRSTALLQAKAHFIKADVDGEL